MDYLGCKIKNALAVNELIAISKQQFSDGYFFHGESHNFYEAVCVLDGTVGITADKKAFVMSAGQMTIHPPKEFHAIWEHNNSRPKCIIIAFSASAFPKIGSHIYNLNEHLIKDIEDFYETSKDVLCIKMLTDSVYPVHSGVTEFDYGLSVFDIKENMLYEACKLVKEFELFLMSAISSASDSQTRIVDSSSENYSQILEIMEKHLSDNINMKELSELCGMSVPLIEKTVYKYLRCGAMSYYNNIRMDRAYNMLSLGEAVKNVASELNFSSQNYFSLSFKKHFGFPPSELKSNSRGK